MQWRHVLVCVPWLVTTGCIEPKDDEDSTFGVMDSEGPATTTAASGDDDDDGPGGTSVGETGAGETNGGGESTGDGTECGAAARCMTPAPDGWMGPIAVHRGPLEGTPPACADGFPSGGLTLYEGFHDPGPASCGCECGINLVNYCTKYLFDWEAGCGSQVGQINFTGSDCDELTSSGGTSFYMFGQGQPVCQPTKIIEAPDVPWDNLVSSCAGAAMGDACADGVCTPEPPEGYEAGLCIFAQGDMECPAGDFSEKLMLHSGTDDMRNCGPCTCGTGSPTCTGTLDVFSSADCSGAPLASLDASSFTCVDGTGDAQSAVVTFDADPTCPVEMVPEPVGDIAPSGEFTYCCEAA